MMTKGVYVPSLKHLAKTMIDNVNLHNLRNIAGHDQAYKRGVENQKSG